MTTGLIGRKLGMTRVFAEDGTAVPVTVIEAGPCRVVQVRDGGVQLGFGARRAQRTTKAELGHAKKAGLDAAPQVLRVFGLSGEAPTPGAEIKVDIFAAGERVKVTGTTKGRGFQGVVHRYGFDRDVLHAATRRRCVRYQDAAAVGEGGAAAGTTATPCPRARACHGRRRTG